MKCGVLLQNEAEISLDGASLLLKLPHQVHDRAAGTQCGLHAVRHERFERSNRALKRHPERADWVGSFGQVVIPGWAHISSSRWSLTTKLINGQFSNWRQVIPREDSFKRMIRLTPEAVTLLQTVLPNLPGNEAPMQPVHLVVRPGVFIVRGLDKLSGKWTEVRVPGAEVSGEPNETTINRDYFLKALRFGLTEILVEDSLASMVFRAEGKQLIVMPIRPDGASTPAKPVPTPNNPTPQPEAAQSVTPSTDQPTTPTELETKETMSSNTSNTPQTPNRGQRFG